MFPGAGLPSFSSGIGGNVVLLLLVVVVVVVGGRRESTSARPSSVCGAHSSVRVILILMCENLEVEKSCPWRSPRQGKRW